MLRLKNILVPTDFTTLSKNALKYAVELAESMKAKIFVLYVLDKSPITFGLRPLNLTENEIIEAIEQEAKKNLLDIKNEFCEDSEINLETVFRKGTDYEEIISFSKEIGADLIVMATNGRTGVFHELLGSVTEKVVRFSKCPVLVIPYEESN